MKLRPALALVFTLLVLVYVMISWNSRSASSRSEGDRNSKVEKVHHRSSAGAAQVAAADAAKEPSAGDSSPAPDGAALTPAARKVFDQLMAALEELKSGDPARRKAALDLLNQTLAGEGHDPAASIAAILEFLKSGLDAATGEEFSVGEHGVLASSNMLRVFLLDHLGTLSLDSNSPAAITVAHEILSQFGSADEWAVCLRNVAWLDPQNSAYLTAKAGEMLGNQAWQENPTRGFLEAFDVVVHSGASELIPQLQKFLATSEENPLWRAAAVAMDGLAQAHPDTTMKWLNSHPEALADSPGQRADLFAKADMGNASQRDLVETYLGRTDVTDDEKGSFLGGLLAPGAFLANNLITKPHVTPSPADERDRLANLNRIGQEWMNGNRFPRLTGRLAEFIKNTVPPKE